MFDDLEILADGLQVAAENAGDERANPRQQVRNDDRLDLVRKGARDSRVKAPDGVFAGDGPVRGDEVSNLTSLVEHKLHDNSPSSEFWLPKPLDGSQPGPMMVAPG